MKGSRVLKNSIMFFFFFFLNYADVEICGSFKSFGFIYIYRFYSFGFIYIYIDFTIVVYGPYLWAMSFILSEVDALDSYPMRVTYIKAC